MSQNKRKEEIAEVFRRHFEHYGYKKTSVDDISEEMKISKKTIYQFFNKKEEIFYYIISKIAQKIANQMWKKLEGYDSQEAKMRQLLKMIFEESAKWLKKEDAFEFKYKYEIAELSFKEAHGALLSKIIKTGINSGEFSKGNAELKLSFIKGVISESMRLLATNPDLEIGKETTESVLKLLK
jgi:AcrR family transcriptional regulator